MGILINNYHEGPGTLSSRLIFINCYPHFSAWKLKSKVCVQTLATRRLCLFHSTSLSQNEDECSQLIAFVIHWLVILTVSLDPQTSSYLFLRPHHSCRLLNGAFGIVNIKSFTGTSNEMSVFFS